MHWVIDGYNVVNRAPRLADRDDGRQALVNLLANAAQRSRDRFTVVFDGRRGGSRAVAATGIRVIYSSFFHRAIGRPVDGREYSGPLSGSP